MAGLIRAFTAPVSTASPVEVPSLDISTFTTAERRQVADLLLEMGERGRVATSEGASALAAVLSFLEGTLASVIPEAGAG